MAHSEEDFREILNAESFVDREALAAAAKDGVPAAVRAEAGRLEGWRPVRTAGRLMGYPRGDLRYIGPGENVFMFIPNLIGYARVVRALRAPAPAAAPA